MSMTLLVPAVLMGFLGSPHCMGMCGGIVTAFGISMKSLSPKKRGVLITTYHVGRIVSYMGLGVLATLLGQEVLAPFLTNNALPRIALGVALVFASLLMLGVPFLSRLERLGLGLWNALSPIRQKVLPMDSVPKALSAGLLWGLLPCGLVYGALVMAMSVSATSTISGMGVLFMMAFGVGTLPMLVLTGTALSWLQSKVKAFNLRKFSGAIMLVSGLSVMVSPTVMHLMHGNDHSHHHGEQNHTNHTTHHDSQQNDHDHQNHSHQHDHHAH